MTTGEDVRRVLAMRNLAKVEKRWGESACWFALGIVAGWLVTILGAAARRGGW